MHQITKDRKLLQPLRMSPRVHIVAAFHYILSFLALAAIALIISGFALIVYGALADFNINAIVWGVLIMMSCILALIPAVVIAESIDPQTQLTSDALILKLYRAKSKTLVIKENHSNRVVGVGKPSSKTGLVSVVLHPENLGEYSNWVADLPAALTTGMAEGWQVRYRRIIYQFPGWDEYQAQSKVIVHDPSGKVRGVAEIYDKKTRRGVKGVDRNGFKVRKEVRP